MSDGTVIHVLKETITLILMVAGPMLLVSLTIGLLISIFQATTQIQEQTLTFVPKLFGVMLTALLLGGWMLNMILDFAQNFWSNLGGFI